MYRLFTKIQVPVVDATSFADAHVFFPLRLRGVHVKSCPGTEIPSVVLSEDIKAAQRCWAYILWTP